MAGGRTSEKLTKRAVDAAQPQAKRYWLRDGELRGFAVRVLPSGVKTYVAVYRAGTGRGAPQREYTIGQHGEVTLDQAREEARRVLGAARLGGDPQGERVGKRSELTVAQLCDLYLTEGVATKKASTLATDRGRITTHIKPLLGKKHISSVTSGDVERFMRDVAQGKTATEPTKVRPGVISHVRGGKGTASRTVGLLGGIFSFAVRHKLRPDNPVRGVTRYKDGRSERFLSAKELARLGEAITKAAADGSNTKGLAVIRLLTTTGARKSEIEGLRWDEIDFEQSALRLRDSKTGAKVIAIGAPALSLLAELAAATRSRQVKAEVEANAAGQPNPVPSPWVFPAGRGSAGHWVGTAKVWTAIRAKADLADVRLHDLRHTYASLAVGASGGGQSLAVIGKLLGHADVRTTARYAHLADDPVRQAANRCTATSQLKGQRHRR